jgi:hypothetical protein
MELMQFTEAEPILAHLTRFLELFSPVAGTPNPVTPIVRTVSEQANTEAV